MSLQRVRKLYTDLAGLFVKDADGNPTPVGGAPASVRFDVSDPRIGLVGTPMSGGTPAAEDAAFSRIYALAAQYPHAHFDFGYRKYGTTKPVRFRKFPYAHVHGNGAVIQNLSPTNSGLTVINTNPGTYTDQTDDPAVPGAIHDGWLINTVAAFSNAVVTTTHSDAGNLAPGDWVLVDGWVIQGGGNGGYPPNPLFKDWMQVKSVNATTGQIVFNSKLRNRYRSDWYDYTPGAGNYHVGKARIRKLSRGAGFTLCEYLFIENLTLLDNPTYPNDAINGGFGQLYVTGAKFAHLKNVRAGNFVPSECHTVIVDHCDFFSVEIDKVLHKVEFRGGSYGTLQGGSGCDHILLTEKAEVIDQVSLESNNIEMYGPIIETDDSGSAMTSMVAPYINVISPTDRRRNPQNDAPVWGPSGQLVALPSTVISADATTMKFDLSLGDQWLGIYQLRPGCEIFKGTQPTDKRGILKDLYYDSVGNHAVIEVVGGWKGGIPTTGEQFYYKPHIAMRVLGGADEGGNPARNATHMAFPSRVQIYTNDAEGFRDRLIVQPFAEDLNARPYEPNGFILEYGWHVTKAVANSYYYFSVPAGQVQVDGGTLGMRRVGDNYSRLLGGDTGSAFPTDNNGVKGALLTGTYYHNAQPQAGVYCGGYFWVVVRQIPT